MKKALVNKKKKGFTLIELIIVLAVMAIIAAIAVPSYNAIKENSARKADEQSRATVERVATMLAADGSLEDLKKGVEMTMKGCKDAFAKLGVEEIDATGEFDPNLHNAVMHIEDENLGTNVVAEVFHKGYKKDNKIIRHSMVKVAN